MRGERRAEMIPDDDGRPSRWVAGYVVALAVVAACSAVSLAGTGVLGLADRVLLFPLGVLVVAARYGIGPAIFAALGGVLAFDYLFVPPENALSVGDGQSVLTMGIMLAVAGVVSVLTDRLRRQAVHARRQAHVEGLRNALLSAMSHDLRAPLNAIVGASRALYEDTLGAEERRQLTRMVSEESERLARLVKNLLELTRLESGRVRVKGTPQAIDEVIGSALVRLEHALAGRTVRTDVPEEVPLACFDPVLVEQVLINLIENAMRYTPPSSPIELTARYEDERILVEVADRGPGVPRGAEDKVFERLYRGDQRTDGGFGLGLTICRAIITAHQGHIWLENRAGGGTVVTFALPVDKGADAFERYVAESRVSEVA